MLLQDGKKWTNSHSGNPEEAINIGQELAQNILDSAR
jgi:hypothetical protein